MSVSSLALDPTWRDYFGMWNPITEPLVAPIELSKCHGPRLALAPDQQHQAIPASGKIEYNFHLVPGSIIWGLWVTPDVATNTYAIQLTDVSLEHEWFQEPVNPLFLQTFQNSVSTTSLGVNRNFPSFTMLPTPHPVVGDGLFTLEVWGTVGTFFYLVLGVAEVTDCPVR